MARIILPVWNDLLKVKDLYLKGRIMIVGVGEFTDSWKDAWCGRTPLEDKFPGLFAICNEPSISVKKMA